MDELLAIFCDVDDFFNAYKEYCEKCLLMDEKQVLPRMSMYLS